MSNVGQGVTAIVGGVVGFIIGGPGGAAYGFQLGLLAGSALFPTQLPGVYGPQLTDQRTTTAEVGLDIPESWGRMPVSGNVIFASELRTATHSETAGGKGAPEQKVTTYSYFQTIAVLLTENEQRGILAIWENGALKYDVRPQREDESDEEYQDRVTATAEYSDKFVFYPGNETQLPDPTLEAIKGFGNVPAYRGYCYVVFPERELLQDQGYRHPNFQFLMSDVDDIASDFYIPVEGIEYNFDLSEQIQERYGVDVTTLDYRPTVLLDVKPGASIGSNIGKEDTPGATWAVHDSLIDAPLGATFALGMRLYIRNQGRILGEGGWGAQHDEGLALPANLRQMATPGGNAIKINGISCLVLIDNGIGRIRGGGGGGALSAILTRAAGGGGGAGLSPGAGGRGTYELNLDSERGDSGEEETGGEGGDSFELSTEIKGGSGGNPASSGGQGSPFYLLSQPGPGGKALVLGETSTNKVVFRSGDEFPNVAGTVQLGDGVFPDEDFIFEPEQVSLARIVRDICLRATLTEAQIDVTDLQDVLIEGYRRPRVMPARAAIEPLRSIGFFDIVESGRKLKFVTRGKAPVATLTDEDLAVRSTGTERPPLTLTRKIQDVELPRRVFLGYLDPDRDYEVSQQPSPERQTTKAVNDVKMEVAAAISATRAKQCAEVVWADAWRSRWAHPLRLGRGGLPYEPSDVVLVPVEGRLQRLRFVTLTESLPLLRQAELVRDDDGSYVSEAIADPPERIPSSLAFYALTNLLLIDIPALFDSHDDAGLYAAAWRASSSSWPGCVVYRSSDGGGTWTDIGAITSEAYVGTLVDPLGIGNSATWDEENELIVDIIHGDLTSFVEEAILNGEQNAAAIGRDGRWEIIQWVFAEQIAPGRYRLSKLLRGRRGTEHFIGTSVAGDTFVRLDVTRLPMELSARGAERMYRAVTINKAFTSGTDQSFTNQSLALKPFSPVDIEGERSGPGDLTITWTRRGRLGQEAPPGADIPLSEETEAYEIDIIGETGGTDEPVVRTLTSSTTSVVYTAAQQTTDFGGAQPSVSVRIFQISATVGRGTPGEAIV